MAEQLTLDEFWEIVERGRRKDESVYEVTRRLKDTLSAIDVEKLLQWGAIFDRYHALDYKNKLWGAANIMDDGFCSDDGFIDFRAWLISQGREVYHAALLDPDSLASLPVQDSVRFESVNYVVMDIYENVHGGNYTDAIVAQWPPPGIEDEIMAGITYAEDIDGNYINGHYPHIFPNLTKLYEHDDLDMDIDEGDMHQLRRQSKHLLHFSYAELKDGGTGQASIALAHEIVESICDNTQEQAFTHDKPPSIRSQLRQAGKKANEAQKAQQTAPKRGKTKEALE